MNDKLHRRGDGQAPPERELTDESGRGELLRHAAMHRRIQRKATRAEATARAPIPESGGSELSAGDRERLEPKLGADLSGVRVHTSGESHKAAAGLNARAFTVGNDIHFGAGEFAPGSREGDRLLAHELTHVVQGQKSGVQRKATDAGERRDDQVSQPGDPAEREADSVADGLVGELHDQAKPGARPAAQWVAAAPIQRKAPPEAEAGTPEEKAEEKEKEEEEKQNDQEEEKADEAALGEEAPDAKPNPKDGGDGKAADLSDEERWKKIEEFLKGSPTGQKALELKKTHNIQVKWQDGGGSAYDMAGTMVLDTSRPTERVALAFVHEMNHAKYDKEGLAVDGKVTEMSREDYVEAQLKEEAEGVCLSVETKIELEANGQKVSVGYPLEDEYREAYKKAAGALPGKDDKDKTLKGDGKTAARKAVLQGFKDGKVSTGTTGESYPEYYGKIWDKKNKDKGKK